MRAFITSRRRPLVIGLIVAATLFAAIIAPIARRTVSALGLPPQPQQIVDQLETGPLPATFLNSKPLHAPTTVPTMGSVATKQSADPVDLKLLVIAADGNEADLPAIRQALDYLGEPYTVYVA